jgi:hypothetical protein
MFLKLGFKASQWMILPVKCVFLKTIYKYFHNKELLIEESMHRYIKVHGIIDNIVNKNTMQFMKILRSVRCLKTCFQSSDDSLFIS